LGQESGQEQDRIRRGNHQLTHPSIFFCYAPSNLHPHQGYCRSTSSKDISTNFVIPISFAEFLTKRILRSLIMSKTINEGIEAITIKIGNLKKNMHIFCFSFYDLWKNLQLNHEPPTIPKIYCRDISLSGINQYNVKLPFFSLGKLVLYINPNKI